MEIRLTRGSSRFSQKLRRLLSHLLHIDTLVIDLPSISSSDCASMFRGLFFPNIDFFSTGSLPHNGLQKFLSTNNHITTIVLGQCENCTCSTRPNQPPLTLMEISGPSTCIAPLIFQSPLNKITATYCNQIHTHVLLFASLALSPATLTSLELDFSTKCDGDILLSIAIAAPRIITLKLNEVFSFSGREVRLKPKRKCNLTDKEAQRYPWKDAVNWARDLQALTLLHNFALHTFTRLVEKPGDEASERTMIKKWSGASMNCPTQLRTVVMCYMSRSSASCRSSWVRQGAPSAWYREYSQRGAVDRF